MTGADAKYRSVYEMLNLKTEIRKTKMWEWMEAGNNAIRDLFDVTFVGSGSQQQLAGVDNGWHCLCGGTANSSVVLDENNFRHYLETASVLIGITKFNNLTDAVERLGLANLTTIAAYINAANFAAYNVDTDFSLESDNAGTTSRTAATFAIDTAYHINQVELGASDLKLTMDGTLEVTKTTDRPATRCQIFHSIRNGAGGTNAQSQTRYMEAFNT